MVNPKVLVATIVHIGLLLATNSSAATIKVAPGEWHTLSSFADVRRIIDIDDTLYVTTSGGLLVVTDPSGPRERYANLDGLGTTDIHDVAVDTSGQKWMAGFGRLVKFDRATSRQFLFFDNNNNLFGLYRVVDDGVNLWVGTSLGLVLFSKSTDGGQIEDSYGLFGALNPSPAVYDIWLNGDSIWLATSAGLAVADKSNPDNLKSPANWTTFSIDNFPQLATDTVRRVVGFESHIYLATPKGLFQLDRSPADTTITSVAIGAGVNCADIKIDSDTMFVYSLGAFGYIKNDAVTILPTPGITTSTVTGANNGVFRWLAVRTGGMYQNSTGSYVRFFASDMPGNNVTGLAVNDRGDLTALFFDKGAGTLRDGSWSVQTMSLFRATTAAVADRTGAVWAGTEGDGVYRLTDSSVTKYSNLNSTLRGVSELASYVVTRAVTRDYRHLFASCYRALNGYPVAIGLLDSLDNLASWDSLGYADGITDAFTGSIDRFGEYLAVATEANGLFRYYTGPDIRDRADDVVWQHRESNSFLRSDVVRVVRFSPFGELWAGTNFGLSRFDIDLGDGGRFVNVDLPPGIGPDITALEFDDRGNLWIGAHNGLARRDAVTGEIIVFTSLSGGLVSNDIRALALDRESGILYIATASGISAYGAAVTHPTTDPQNVVAYPNPFEVRDGSERLNFNFAGPFELQIHTLSGELVRQTSLMYWDGRNESGRLVASGVYLFVLVGNDGVTARGKLLLIRP
ncbi:MAG: hypothetical protein AB1644_09450 [Candidatus Zixiibacteriota bacterium]